MPGSSGGSGREQYGVVATRHFESGPPPSKMQLCSLDDGEVYETVKEEEWLTRKKVTTTTTKNIETRTQRQLVLEDGQVVQDSGPVVTTDCKEDTVTQQVDADENLTPEGQEGGADVPPGEDWVPVGGAVVVSEKTEHILNSHQVAENRRETEQVLHCGDVTNQEVEAHVEGRADLRALREARQGHGWELATPETRVVHESARKWGTVDTEDVHETSRVKDGHVVTETERTTQHERYENESLPDSGSSLSDGSVHEKTREASHNISHTKDEDIVEFYGVPRGAPLSQGVKLGEGMHVVSEDFHEDREGEDLDSLSERFRKTRRLGGVKPKPRDATERADALTRRPLDYHQEEETRKSETSRWLENHFGSESGRSGSSHNDLEEESGAPAAGGNVITITMSPRPATPEDLPDAAPPPRPWEASAHLRGSKAPPPPPPPKPAPAWSAGVPASPRQPGPPAEEITDSMIAAARARLRSTGRVLDDSEQGTPPTSPPALDATRFSTSVNAGSYCSPSSPPAGAPRPPDDPVFSSRFRSGSPSTFAPSRLFSTTARNARMEAQSPPDSPPPPLPSTPPPTQSSVGRSQSFNVANKTWLNGGARPSASRPLQPQLKEYRSVEQLDTVGHKSSRRWPQPRSPSPEPVREVHPPPPSRHRTPPSDYPHYHTAPGRASRSSRSSRTTEIATQTSARDSATQTGPSPVPPPRTKRKNKPKTYYFGQDSSYAGAAPNGTARTPVSGTTTVSYTATSRHNQASPKVERRFRTTKTITPVVMATPTAAAATTTATTSHSSGLKNRSWYYRSMDELSSGVDSTPRASWTNTVDPRRKPRNYATEPDAQTLPKKLVNGTSSPSPSKTYIFGGQSASSRREHDSSSHLRRDHSGSLINVSLAGMSSPKRTYGEEVQENPAPSRTARPVHRSHSLNVKPAPLSAAGPPAAQASTGLAGHQRTSSVYRSSPYLNLRSPNLIATIARSNSTRRSEEQENGYLEREEPSPPGERYRHSHAAPAPAPAPAHAHAPARPLATKGAPAVNGDSHDDEKRNRFMKGLLTTAPELFHFIHGEDDKQGGSTTPARPRNSPPESPPQLIRPPSSPLTSPSTTSPPASTAPRIFTFGRGETAPLRRTASGPQEGGGGNGGGGGRLGRPRESITSTHLDSSREQPSNGGSRNSLTSQYHRNAQLSSSLQSNNEKNSLNRPKFNLKTSGGSLLYSSSFRNRGDAPGQCARRGSDPRDHHDYVAEKTAANLTSSLARDGPVLISVRDWNSR